MARWGSGTQEDPYKITSLSDIQSLSNMCGVNVYYEFATEDQQGNPIPMEERIDDWRSRNWVLTSNLADFNMNSNFYNTVVIRGNGWTILGLSLRGSNVFRSGDSGSGGTGTYSKKGNFYLSNLTFKNVYLQAKSSIIYSGGSSSRVTVSNCKFSGVIDNSGCENATNIYNVSAVVRTSGSGIDTYTACSFNFKFVNFCRIAASSGDNTAMELDNCLLNIEGRHDPIEPPNSSSQFYMTLFAAVYYFCKFTGRVIVDRSGNGDRELYLYRDKAGTLNVIDMRIDIINDPGTTYFKVKVHHNNATSCSIVYIDHTAIPYYTLDYSNAASFRTVTDPSQMVDKTWLENQGFIVGNPPSE